MVILPSIIKCCFAVAKLLSEQVIGGVDVLVRPGTEIRRLYSLTVVMLRRMTKIIFRKILLLIKS